ncbi:MAG: 4-hydroxybenzoate octaprenyltransferase [Alphaproteobacteria bacterium]|nr:4-hydroxybenzoate octaprenyltransferase [Alphaproteobacteria bacterium]
MGEYNKNSFNASDIAREGWIKYLPHFAQPYARLARLDRPIGTWLLLLPGWWGLTIGANLSENTAFAPIEYYLYFAIGALVMRGAGCTWNDITDQDFDRKVARTADRPLPSGEVSTFSAMIFLILQCLIGLAILLQFNGFAQIVGISSLLLVAGYPFMKRITYWPQAWLGLTFNWGALVGFAAIHETITLPAILLYIAGLFWTLGYDTIYAHQDKEDDALIGVKSTALRFQENTKAWIGVFYALTLVLIAYAGHLAGLPLYGFIFFAAAALHLAYQVIGLEINNPVNCLKLFKSNRDFGILILLGLLTGGL